MRSWGGSIGWLWLSWGIISGTLCRYISWVTWASIPWPRWCLPGLPTVNLTLVPFMGGDTWKLGRYSVYALMDLACGITVVFQFINQSFSAPKSYHFSICSSIHSFIDFHMDLRRSLGSRSSAVIYCVAQVLSGHWELFEVCSYALSICCCFYYYYFSLSYSLLFDTSRCSSPGIDRFSRDPWFPLLANGI